ncbi:MAG: hypothetical protein WBG86_16180 [Polyangiales bacterium]
MERTIVSACVLGALVGFGCGGGQAGSGGSGGVGGAGGAGPIEGLVSIEVGPGDLELVVDGSMPVPVGYSAMGTFDDGSVRDITGDVRFSLDDRSLGSFNLNQLLPTTAKGGTTNVRASAGSIMGTASLLLKLQRTQNDPSSTDLPTDPSVVFDGAQVDPGMNPSLVYPNAGVLVPPNLRQLEFHVEPVDDQGVFELHFQNRVTDLTVYFTCHLPMNGGCIYTPDGEAWAWLSQSNRGGDPIELTVRATNGAGTMVGTSENLRFSFSLDDLSGAFYYWTTSGGTAIMRYDFGSQEQTEAEKFMGTEHTGGACVGCHSLSRDGTKMVAEAGGQNDGRLLILDVATSTPMVPFGSPPKSIFESWNPDGSQFVGVYADSGATDYNLLLFDGDTGASLGTIDTNSTEADPANHPDWSPDGSRIAFTRMGIKGTNQRMFKGSIEMVTRDEDGWSEATVVVPNESGKNRYYPSFSPDGDLLIFNESRCNGDSETGGECNADMDRTARLWIVRAEPGSTPVALDAANQPGVADGDENDLTNSFPKWSPFVFSRDRAQASRLEWLTFSSTRNYGLRSPPGNGTLIWMVAVEPDKALAGQDPSSAAFAIPYQDLDTSNHIAQWTERIIVVQ